MELTGTVISWPGFHGNKAAFSFNFHRHNFPDCRKHLIDAILQVELSIDANIAKRGLAIDGEPVMLAQSLYELRQRLAVKREQAIDPHSVIFSINLP